MICTGILLAGFIALRRAPAHGISSDDTLDIILVSVPVGVIGARLWYVLFNWEYYRSFYDVINIRAGGLAIHGGLIFGSIAAIVMCRKKKCNPLDVLDFAFPCIALAQAIGRWGNFFNQEAHGSPTDLPWAIVIDGQKVHPTFLYESVWCLILFFVLSAVDKRRRFRGQVTMLYGVLSVSYTHLFTSSTSSAAARVFRIGRGMIFWRAHYTRLLSSFGRAARGSMLF